ncbi:MAG TPA: NnrS family protein [Rubrivivax sp.]|nr:NnrS family protein [Burkholderiales bacterium]HNT37548.1 NnrS family protein [Rubrivivax sp.]
MNALPPDRWRAAELLAQPHRLCFVAAALVWAASALAWALALARPLPAGTAVPPGTLHALAFALGPMPLFFAGFLFTSAPKWLRAPPVPTRALLPGVLALLAGWLLLIALGAWCTQVAALGLALCAAGWAALLRHLWTLHRRATRAAGHFDAIAGVCALLALALAAAAIALLLGRSDSAREIARAAFWGTVLPVFLIASHRMLPFLTHADAPQPDDAESARDARWVVALPLGASLLLALPALPGWPPHWSAALWPLRLLLPGAAAVLTLWLALRWRAHPATRAPLLRRLLRAFAWSGLAWLALAAAALPTLGAAGRSTLEAIGLHAMALGFAGGTMLSMVTRLSATQAGHSQAVDAVARALEAVLQVVVVSRLLALAWPPSARLALPLAALLWAAIALVWLLRHGRWAGTCRMNALCSRNDCPKE